MIICLHRYALNNHCLDYLARIGIQFTNKKNLVSGYSLHSTGSGTIMRGELIEGCLDTRMAKLMVGLW